jgi:DNA-binding transcriptional ArsR family regulator
MSENVWETPSPAASLPPTPDEAVTPPPQFDVVKALAALGNPVRWQAVKLLAGGQVLAVSQVAEALQRDFDGVSKHLRLLRAAGLVASRPGEDRRFELYYIPESFRPERGVLDYGFCRLRLASPD